MVQQNMFGHCRVEALQSTDVFNTVIWKTGTAFVMALYKARFVEGREGGYTSLTDFADQTSAGF